MTPALKKLHLYRRLYAFNRAMTLVVLNCDQLEKLRFFSSERVHNWRVTLQHLQSLANTAMLESLQPCEEKDAYQLDRMLRRWENQNQDPDDVLLAAKERRRALRKKKRSA